MSATGGRKKSGWYINAVLISKRSKAIHARVIPQPAQDIPVIYFIGQVIPIYCIIPYAIITIIIDIITVFACLIFFIIKVPSSAIGGNLLPLAWLAAHRH